MSKPVQAGFTAVEVLVTLFIAAIFLFAGYQLYIQVTRDGTDAKLTAQASNAVYDEMRKQAGQIPPESTVGCNPTEWNSSGTGGSQRTIAPPTSGATMVQSQASLGSLTMNMLTEVRCPFSSPTLFVNVFYIKTEGSYTVNGATRKVSHATYTGN